MEYELVNVEVDQESNSVCFTYTITESSAAKGVSPSKFSPLVSTVEVISQI